MDQRFLAGVGNIYAQEALFKAAIRPTRPGYRITRGEAAALYTALRETLLSAIEHRGSTRRDYRDAFGRSGSAQDLHAVYQRGGKPCLKCAGMLRETRVGGRGTVYCPACQR
jgi:formamidopyrimidine-DNA glycosylase